MNIEDKITEFSDKMTTSAASGDDQGFASSHRHYEILNALKTELDAIKSDITTLQGG